MLKKIVFVLVILLLLSSCSKNTKIPSDQSTIDKLNLDDTSVHLYAITMMFYVKLRQMKVQDLPLSIISKLKKMNMYETWFLLEMKMVNSSKFY